MSRNLSTSLRYALLNAIEENNTNNRRARVVRAYKIAKAMRDEQLMKKIYTALTYIHSSNIKSISNSMRQKKRKPIRRRYYNNNNN